MTSSQTGSESYPAVRIETGNLYAFPEVSTGKTNPFI